MNWIFPFSSYCWLVRFRASSRESETTSQNEAFRNGMAFEKLFLISRQLKELNMKEIQLLCQFNYVQISLPGIFLSFMKSGFSSRLARHDLNLKLTEVKICTFLSLLREKNLRYSNRSSFIDVGPNIIREDIITLSTCYSSFPFQARKIKNYSSICNTF